MEKIIVTSGQPFTDIDALACAVSYTELLKLECKDAKSVLPGPLNKTVIEKINKWEFKFSITHYPKPNTNYSYILVDISDPEYFACFVEIENIIELYDHRYGFENYWKEKLGKNSHIEMVGACATLIWEEFVKRGFKKDISKVSMKLLTTAIISNTLNFKASITTTRDIKAYTELKKYSDLPPNWIETYFKDQDIETDKNIKSAIVNDMKNTGPFIAQLELWDSRKIIDKHHSEIINLMKSFDPDNWFLTAPSIKDGKNYLLTTSKEKKKLLCKAINAKFKGDVGITDKLWLRKEIIQEIKKKS